MPVDVDAERQCWQQTRSLDVLPPRSLARRVFIMSPDDAICESRMPINGVYNKRIKHLGTYRDQIIAVVVLIAHLMP